MVSSFTQRERRDPSIRQQEWRGGVGGWLLLKLKCSGSDRIAFLQLDELGFGVWGSEKEPGSFFLLSSRPEGLPTGHLKPGSRLLPSNCCQLTLN